MNSNRNIYVNKCIPGLLCVLCMCFIMGCGSDKEGYDYQLYYINVQDYRLEGEGYNAYSKDSYHLIGELLAALATEPNNDEVVTPGFDTMKVLGHSDISDEGYVKIDFDMSYNSLATIKETLCRAAIVKTLCQIEGVKGVEFTIDGAVYKNSKGEEYGVMSDETFVDFSVDKSAYNQTLSVSLYFADKSGKKLVKLPVNVTFNGSVPIETLVVQQLIKGPEVISGVEQEIQATIPDTSVINQITVREQICYIDFSEDFLTALPGIGREAALYSVVNSLVDLPGINKVQFSIDGKVMRYFGDSLIIFDKPLERKLELVKE